MASKGRWSPALSNADRAYSKLAARTYRLLGRWPTEIEVMALSERAIAIAARYQRMKRRQAVQRRQERRVHEAWEQAEHGPRKSGWDLFDTEAK